MDLTNNCRSRRNHNESDETCLFWQHVRLANPATGSMRASNAGGAADSIASVQANLGEGFIVCMGS